jgi:hypothetical protein
MPITLSDIAKKTVTITSQYEGESLTVEFYTKRLTLKAIDELQSQNVETVISLVSRLIHSWDIYEDAELTIMTPVTPERLKELPYDLLEHIIKLLLEEIRPEAMAPTPKN